MSVHILRPCVSGSGGKSEPLVSRQCGRRRFSLTMDPSGAVKRAPTVVKLKAIEATPESFAEFGQVISPFLDGEEAFGPNDAQLELHRGVPRFYMMRLEDQKPKFSKITHHASVTQCLGCVGGDEWYLGVAKGTILDGKNAGVDMGKKVVKAASGHFYVPPHPDDVQVFRITGSKFVKLNVGTWHAGPLFRKKAMDFYNLELSNTNVVDHTTHFFSKEDGVVFVIED